MNESSATGDGRIFERRMVRLLGLALSGVLAPLAGFAALAGQRDAAMRHWCRFTARAAGMRIRRKGAVPPPGCLVVANHVGYLDVLALGSQVPGRFLAKAEIGAWPFLGAISRWGGTIFIERERFRASRALIEEVKRRFQCRERVLLFAEAGVSPDGQTLGPFHPMLFEACVATGTSAAPVALRYSGATDRRVWAWIEEPNLWRHLWGKVLPAPEIEVEIRFGEPLVPAPGEGRKIFAARVREAVAGLLTEAGSRPGPAVAPVSSPAAPTRSKDTST